MIPVALSSPLAIATGASIGALIRWRLSLWFNDPQSPVPAGTLASNLAGGLLVGLAVGYFAWRPDLAPEWRMFVITGFLGGLTTFSTFSAEVVALLQQGRPAWAIGVVALHVAGSLVMTGVGLACMHRIGGPGSAG